MSYFDIYKQRLNRFGNDYQSRIQGEREHLFELYLLKSIYRVDFMYNNKHYAGSLEKNKQDNSETRQYLLTQVDLNIPNGTISAYQQADQWKDFFFIYDDVSGIRTTVTDTSESIIVYDLNGHKKEGLQRGINIIKYSDGTVKKVMQK